MSIEMHVLCPHCHARLRGTSHSSFKAVNCPGCHFRFVWPECPEETPKSAATANPAETAAAKTGSDEQAVAAPSSAVSQVPAAPAQPLAEIVEAAPAVQPAISPGATFGNATICFRCGKQIAHGEARFRASVATGSSQGNHLSLGSLGMLHREYRGVRTICADCQKAVSKESANATLIESVEAILLVGVAIFKAVHHK